MKYLFAIILLVLVGCGLDDETLAASESGNPQNCLDLEYDTKACLERMALLEKNPDVCDELDVSNSDKCKEKTALGAGESSFCQKMSFGSEKCVLRVAKKEKDTSICPEINDEYLRAQCVREIAVQTGNYDACAEIALIQQKDVCYSKIAEEAGSQLCSFVEDSYAQEKCFTDSSRDKSTCDDNLPEEKRDKCYLNVAKNTLDPELCALITNHYSFKSCYNDLALKTGDWGLCENLEGDSDKDHCVSSVAVSKRSVPICDDISDESTKERCVARASS